MTIFYANHTITIYRNRRKGTSNKYGMSATFTGYDADIQPASNERQIQFSDHFGAVFTAYVDTSAGIQEGDQIVDDDGKRYSVKGIQKWDGGGGFAELDCLELVLTALDAV